MSEHGAEGSDFSFNPARQHMFEPAADITVQELAMVLKELQISVTDGLYDNMPEEVKRHFT